MIILVVEDESIIGLELEGRLQEAGHEVLGPTSTVEEALELAERRKPDLALVDINLGDGGSGIELARRLLERWGTPSLFLSGQTQEARENNDAAIGRIGKPFSATAVLESIDVAKAIAAGEPVSPVNVPPELELFRH
jgi:two-component system, response regulator PdtaR